MITVNVKDVIGKDLMIEDAILLKAILKDNLGSTVILDFAGIENVPCTFFSNLLTSLILSEGRDFISSKVIVKNLSKEENYKRVLLGTAFYN
jgi:hypothetical protein